MEEDDEPRLLCPRCHAQRLEPAGEAKRPYWWCPDCGAIRSPTPTG